MIGGSLCASMCGCGEEDDVAPIPYEPVDRVAVYVVDNATNKFEGGSYYFFNQVYPTFTLKVENIPANDVGYITVNFEEANKMIYYATQIFNGNGEIIVPKPFYDASYFDVLETEDFVAFPENAVELTNVGNKDEVYDKWAAIQKLRLVRMGMELENNKFYYFKQHLDGVEGESTKWIFISKY